MARKRQSDVAALRMHRHIEVHLSGGLELLMAYGQAGVNDAICEIWSKKFGGMGDRSWQI